MTLVLLIVSLVVALIGWGLKGVGQWLVIEDALERTNAIVVLGGQRPFRAMEAARLYREGWAPEVWVTRGERRAKQAALRKLGENVYNQQVMERLGVPRDAIRRLPGAVESTLEEVQLIRSELQRLGGDRVMLVTSKSHSRRARAMWRSLSGDAGHAIVRYVRDDPYDARHWWRRSNDALAVFREVFGLVNMWAGFPVSRRSERGFVRVIEHPPSPGN